MLRNSDKPLSGERISEKLNVSRVAVWKQIKTLKDLGYHISSSSSGYTLDENTDHLYSWEFEGGKEHYQAFRELDSTMDLAREYAREGCTDFTTVVAESQKKGRGRGSHQWISPEGGLYFTWVIKAGLPLAYHYIYTFGAAAALVQSVRALTGIELSTKWPNDVYRGDKKVAGFLTEMETSGDSLKWLNLGIGINVNNEETSPIGISLKEINGSVLDRRDLLTQFEKTYRSLLRENNPEEIRKLWCRKSLTLGKKVALKTADKRLLEGTAKTIDSSGSLIIENKNNKTQQALFGDLYVK